MKTTVIEHFNSILFYMSRPANKQRTYQSINIFHIIHCINRPSIAGLRQRCDIEHAHPKPPTNNKA